MNLADYLQNNLPETYKSINIFIDDVDITLLKRLNSIDFKNIIPIIQLRLSMALLLDVYDDASFSTSNGTLIKYKNHQFIEKYSYFIRSTYTTKWLEECSVEEIKELTIEPTLPISLDYVFEKRYEKKDGYYYLQPIEYVNNKTYFDYSENSYERTHWGMIEYENKHWNENVKLYHDEMEVYLKNKHNVTLNQSISTNWYNKECIKLMYWVNENVFSDDNLCDINTKTNMVLIRIATGMINKLSCITEDEKKRLHNLLIEFYTERKRVYMDYYYMEVLGFPF